MKIQNIGSHDSGAVVLLFYESMNVTQSQYIRKLVGYDRIDMLRRKDQINLRLVLDDGFYESKEYEKFHRKFVFGGDYPD